MNQTNNFVEYVYGKESGIGVSAADQITPAGQRKKSSQSEDTRRGNNGQGLIAKPVRQKMIKAKQMLDSNRTIVVAERCRPSVHFRNRRRGSIGNMGGALMECPPSWLLLYIPFVGGSVMESVTDYNLNEWLIVAFKVMNIRKVENFTMFGDAVQKRKNERSNVEEKEINLKKAERRMEYCRRKTTSQFAWKWYDQKAKSIKKAFRR